MSMPVGLPAWALPDPVDRPNPPDPLGNGVPVPLRPGAIPYWFQYDRSLQYWTGGGSFTSAGYTSTLAAMKASQADGYAGWYLDPAFVWTMHDLGSAASSAPINGLSNFIVSMSQMGSIGWLANVSFGVGYIDVGTGSDGIQIYASSPASAHTQGVVFDQCVIQGTNTNATVHLGGGQRACGFRNCLVINNSSATGAYAVIPDTALSDNNSENAVMDFTGGGGLVGGYGALGLGIADQTQHANDTIVTGLRSSAGSVSVHVENASNWLFTLPYDRSSPSIANWVINGGVITVQNGEDLNNTGAAYNVAGGVVSIDKRLVTAGNINVSSGTVHFAGRCRVLTTVAMSGTGIANFSDPAFSGSNTTVTGSAGTVYTSGRYTATGPNVAGFSGTLHTSAWTT